MSCALVAFRCLTALLVCTGAWAQEVPIGGTLPNATLQGLNGPTRHLSDYRGKPLLINVWASWCGPCREEMASLERLAWLDKKPQFAIIGISTDDLAEHAASLLVRTNATIAHFIDSHPELMCRDAAILDPVGATLVVGPGLGQSAEARALVRRALASQAALVLDADALNLVAVDASLQQALAARARRGAVTILTPHPLEAGRLLSIGAAQVQADRLHAAHTLAARYRAVIVLKGSGTVIADAEALLINSTGNPALATGGTGDVLSGMCGALLAQRWPAAQAAAAAVWIHGRAADLLVQQGTGPVGVSASEIIDGARQVLNQLIAQQRPAWRA